MPTRAPVAIVGVGVKAPGGATISSLWTSLCAGYSSAKPYIDPRLPEAWPLGCRDAVPLGIMAAVVMLVFTPLTDAAHPLVSRHYP